jgi:adenine-specific DNA-methyltransferase
MTHPTKPAFESKNIPSANITALAQLFPSCITESRGEDGKLKQTVDFEKLRALLGSDIAQGDESYDFTWVGKKVAMQEAGIPVRKTLRPCTEESRDWDTTQNLYIEGDNLDVLKLLQESYLKKVKMIYIDPPYNTGNDFIYNDHFETDKDEYEEGTGAVDDSGIKNFQQNNDANPRFHSDWCSMIYPRLVLARNLLTDDGVIFISIDDNEVHNLRKIGEEIFGESNFIGQIAIVNNLKGRNDSKDIATCHEYILIFGKTNFSANGLPLSDEQRSSYNLIDSNGNQYKLRDLRKRGRPDRREDRPNMYFPIYYNTETKECSLENHKGWIRIVPLRGDDSDGRWRWGKERVQQNLSILEPRYSEIAKRWGIEHRVYLNPSLNPSELNSEDDEENVEERDSKSKSFWIGSEFSTDVGRRQLKELFGTAYFDYPKTVEYIKNSIYMGAEEDSIILDFFSGSATTAHAVMQLNAEDGGNRKFIMVQLPEKCAEDSEAYKAGYKTICDIGKERIRRAGDKIKAELEKKNENKSDVDANPQLDLTAENTDNSLQSNKLQKLTGGGYFYTGQRDTRFIGHRLPCIQSGRQQYERCVLFS